MITFQCQELKRVAKISKTKCKLLWHRSSFSTSEGLRQQCQAGPINFCCKSKLPQLGDELQAIYV